MGLFSLNRKSFSQSSHIKRLISGRIRCVYYCMEYMDAGSLDKLEGDGIPEGELGRIAGSMVRGLKFLKDEMQIIHRGTFVHFISVLLFIATPHRCEADQRARQ